MIRTFLYILAIIQILLGVSFLVNNTSNPVFAAINFDQTTSEHGWFRDPNNTATISFTPAPEPQSVAVTIVNRHSH